ncbi:DcrB family lipoprotein [Yersinia ruckeri]|uniref:Inner membrane lipoprotein DcrB n=1 Tax=Yersinia ruckeri TaxID=29486 RepID=A0A085U6H9_YERRU|nr:DcrB family lipoprotein [Yersinia ruckeri]ARZ02639.1 hypothetical protein QMA0440_03345 [Yersinia ruckeri]AUQ41361.1 DUF1795 domain-containing protein [Yersinia ruckeri]EEP97599.1 hypothetical protein yruck0001_34470 [Yersinia ruckeri ATCC 29473]EKN4199539.1 DcrB family lipoprotein [Yersinia ruckeri]EKN4206102.1 DcrB family lipoprotein [Yersinia ruckeri]
MNKMTKLFAVGLLVSGLSACDVKNDNNVGQPLSLLDGNIALVLPAEFSDQSDKISNPASNKHVYATNNGEKAVVIILNDKNTEKLDVLAQRLIEQQKTRDANLQIVTNKSIEIDAKPLQQLDSIITSGGQKAYSSVVMGNVGNNSMTLQITLPAENQQQAQTEAESIISSLKLK